MTFERRSGSDKAVKVGLAVAGVGGAAGLGLLAYATVVEPNWIEVSEVELTLPRLSPSFDGYRIAHISDIHAGRWLPIRRLDRLVEMVNEQGPDLIAITGDFVSRVYLGAPIDVVPSLRNLKAKDGVAAVLGNHDYWGKRGPGLIRHAINESGLIDLNNKVHTIERDGERLHVAGVDSARQRMDRLDLVLSKLPDEGAAILLAHEPDYAAKSARTLRFDLQLSGHAHGGQVCAPLYGPLWLPPMGRKYHTGLYKVGDMLLYTNRGLGMVKLPIRFLSRPEIAVLTLRSGSR